ncbi:hypothetical protein [Lentzea sp. NBRC 102530]|uniref:hypothetical protein n=1 Tax=Lentzea sp. NBRC 102530 TaxID=3032201 RepID=UPI0024A475CF|nr:hypothetical protein [Lentzea sp. NBRC 102530]GLY53063.1 hypothetical protein Lesp01_67190 [Lentzea sp. NBRC 102530]
MSTRLLPAVRAYRCVDEDLVRISLSAVRRRFEVLLAVGVQAKQLPGQLIAAGQYLDRHGFDQRGLFGTAAAILVLAQAGQDEKSIETIQALVDYLHDRAELEPRLAASPEEAVEISRRIEVEQLDTFKTADLVFALSFVPAVVSRRDELLRSLTRRIDQARLPQGGWATRLDGSGEFNALATAHVLRAIRAAAVPVRSGDTDALVESVLGGEARDLDKYVRCFALLALTYCDIKEHRSAIEHEFRRLTRELRADLGVLAEANYEYTAGRRQYYVRIPWQLYLVELTVRLHPTGRFFHSYVQDHLLQVVDAVTSPEGFRYPASGSAQSTRTYGTVCNLLHEIHQRLTSVPRMRMASRTINSVTRFAYSKAAATALWLSISAVVVITTVQWWLDDKSSAAELTPNFLATFVLVLGQIALNRVRR